MKNQNTPEMSFEDSENHSGAENLSIQQIVLKNLQRCVEEGSKEMDGGGYRRRFHDGEVVEILVPNQREVFSNSIQMLWVLVYPFFLQCKDEEIIKEIETIEIDLKKIEEITPYELNQRYGWVNKPSSFYDDLKTIDRLNQQYRSDVQKRGKEYKEVFAIKLYHKKLTAISRLLKSIDYFSEGGYSS